MSRLISEIGDAHEIYLEINELDGKIETLRSGSYANFGVVFNGKAQGRSAVEALAPALLSFFSSKRRSLVASLTERGFEDG